MTKISMEKTELEKKLEAELAQEQPAPEPESPQTPEETEERSAVLQAEMDALKAERDQLRDQFLRSRAEFENYRKRKIREEEQLRKTAARKLVADLLPVLDHLELALAHTDDTSGALGEGVAMVAKQFREVLERHGVEAIPAVGTAFDPSVHEAVMEREAPEVPQSTVLEEVQRGYLMGGHLIRPAKVVVSVGGPPREKVESTSENTEAVQADIEASASQTNNISSENSPTESSTNETD